MATARRLVVTGATGKQGGALISSLLSRPDQPFEIFAVTRNKDSHGAQKLASSSSKVHVIQGDFSNPEAIFKQVDKPWGLFSVTMIDKGSKTEEAQGKAMTAAALTAGVQHIVFTATDRGGAPASDTDPTPIPHFASKFRIEQDIRARAPAAAATWTFLRPVAFMENLSPGYVGKGFTAMWRLNGEAARPLQLVATADIGRVAAEAFLAPDAPQYRNAAISLAGDELSVAEAARVFREVTGQEIPESNGFVGRLLKFFMRDLLGVMFDWFKAVGFGADVADIRRRYPFMLDFRAWLEQESAWKKK